MKGGSLTTVQGQRGECLVGAQKTEERVKKVTP